MTKASLPSKESDERKDLPSIELLILSVLVVTESDCSFNKLLHAVELVIYNVKSCM